MSPKSNRQKHQKHITQEKLLRLLGNGALTVVSIFSSRVPNARQILLGNMPQEIYPSAVLRTARRLYRKGLVRVSETKTGYKVEITKKGKIEILKFDLNTLEIEKPDQWDGKWRIVFFDIPEKFKKQRDFLCRKLKTMNFYQIQESVFIHPFACEKEIQYLREILNVPHAVKMGLLEKIENEEELKRIFKIVPKNKLI